jgi:ADP-ribosylglycohydrolase
MLKNKICGAIYGQFIGDSLGTFYEFKSSNNCKDLIKKNLTLNYFLPIIGGGPFNVVAGQVTDDTELAMGLLYGILENGFYKKECIAQKYIKWFKSEPFDIGNTTYNAFNGANTYNDLIRNSQKHNLQSLSNGCLMRVSPLGIYGLLLPDEILFQYCKEDTMMTNPHPIAIDAVQVYCIAIKTALMTSDKVTIFDKACDTAKTKIVQTILADSLTNPDPVVTTKKTFVKTDSDAMGYLGIALQNAFYELLNGKSFYESMLNIVSRGGDTDTNCCIAGALLGAYYGILKMPKEWAKSVEINNPRTKKYPEINQMGIRFLCDKLYELIKN